MSTKAESWRFTTMGMGIPGQGATCTNSELWKSRSYKQQIAQDGKSKVHVSGNIREEGDRWLRDLIFHKKASIIYFSLEEYALKSSSSVHSLCITA